MSRMFLGAMAVALAVAPFAFLDGNFDPANLPQSAWVQVTGLAFAAWTLMRSARLGRSAVDLPLGMLVAWGVLSLAWATSRGEAVPVAMQWIGCTAWFVAVSRTVASPGDARVLALALFASGAAVAALGLAQHLFAVSAFDQAVPPAATFVNKNIAAQYVAATWPLGLAVLAGPVGWRRAAVAACALAAGLMAVFVAVAVTRSAWLAAGVEIATVVALLAAPRWPRGRRVVAAMPVAAVVAAVAISLGGGGRASASVDHRRAIWLNTAAMIADAPMLGVGLGNHKVHYPPYARAVAVDERMGAGAQLDHVHNDALQLAAETGLVGVALCVWLLWASVATWRRAAVACPPPLAAAWAAAWIGIAVDALFSFPMQRALPPAVLAVGLGSMAGLAGLRAGPPRAVARGLAAVAVVTLAAIGLWQSRAIRADRHVAKMLVAEGRGRWSEVRDEASIVLAARPDDRRALFSLATAELARRRIPEARSALQRVLQEYPHDLPALGNLALVSTAAGDDAAALASWERVLALDPRDHRAHFNRGEILERHGDAKGALDAFRAAVDNSNRNARYQMRLGLAAARAGSSWEALGALRTAVILSPGDAATQQALGDLLLAAGRADEARAHFEQRAR